MKIAVDASALLPPRTGVGNFTLNALRALLALDNENDYTILCNSLRRPLPPLSWLRPRQGLEVHRWRIPGPWLLRAWQRWQRPSLRQMTGDYDLAWAPSQIPPPVPPEKLVLSLHDCYYLRHPERTHRLGGQYLAQVLPDAARQAAAIVCVSEFTRREAIEILDLDPRRLHVARPGVDPRVFHPITDEKKRVNDVQRRHNLPAQFFLSVATLEPRKNFPALLHAMARLRDILPDPPKLLCVGAQGFDNSPVFDLYKQLRLQSQVFFLGYVPEEDLPVLYNLATALIMPSHYEGFGLPVLEAMACGLPVLCSQAPALREAGGEAALYADTEDADAMARILRRLCLEPALRLHHAREGLQHAARHNWRDTACQTLAIFENLAARQA